MREIPFHERAHGADPLDTAIPPFEVLPAVPYMTQIMAKPTGNFYLGGVHEDMALPQDVKYVVSLHPTEYKGTFDRGRIAVQFNGVRDQLDQDPSILAVAADVTSALLDRRDGSVLVHCQAGVNRSATVAALTLMNRLDWNADRAVTYLRWRRSSCVLCNPTFEDYVRSYKRETP